MRVIATTVVRESMYGKQRTGYVYEVDFDTQQILRRFPVPDPAYPESDDNPRGGARGGRGVAFTPHGLFIANYDTIYRYDGEWNMLDSLSHPLFVGIHEICWARDQLWVTATGIDAVLRVSLDGDVEVAWDPHSSDLVERLGLRLRPDPVDGSVDYRTRQAPLIDECHINAVSFFAEDMIVNLGLMRKQGSALVRTVRRARARSRRVLRIREKPRTTPRYFAPSMVVRVRDDEAEILVEVEKGGSPTHNAQLLDAERLAVNVSSTNTFRMFWVSDGTEILRVPVAGTWLRGMHAFGHRRVLVGTAPAAVVLIDLAAQKALRQLQLSEDPNEAIHGLTARGFYSEIQ